MSTNTPHLAQDLFRIHKVITRGLLVGHRKGEEYLENGFALPNELPGYSSYIHSLAAVLGTHHTGEDLIAFPIFKKVIPMAPYTQLSLDHHRIETLLTNLPDALKALPGDTTDKSLMIIVDTIKKISDVWFPHIQVEELNFSEEAVNTVLSPDEQQAISQASSKHSQEHSEPAFWIMPFVLFNLEPEERTKMATLLPPVIMNELIPIVWKDQWAPMKPFLLE